MTKPPAKRTNCVLKSLIITMMITANTICKAQTYIPISIQELKSSYEQSGDVFLLEGFDLQDQLTNLFQKIDTIEKPIEVRNCRIQSFELKNKVLNYSLEFHSNLIDSMQFSNLSLDESRFGSNTINYALKIDSCTLQKDFIFFNNSFVGLDLWFEDNLSISNSKFDYFLMLGNSITRGTIAGNTFTAGMSMSAKQINQSMIIADNTFHPIEGNISFWDPTLKKPIIYKNQFSFNPNEPVDFLGISNNSFLSSDQFQTVEITGAINSLSIEENDFQSLLVLAVSIGQDFRLMSNQIRSAAFGDMSFSETSNFISWDDLAGYKLVEAVSVDFDEDDPDRIGISADSLDPFFKQSMDGDPVSYFEPLIDINDSLHQVSYNKLIRSYYKLYSIQKQNGNIRSANGIYREMQEMEGKVRALYFRRNPTFNNYFSWKLNRLMGFYTGHGTDPARAITLSIYIIFVFGIFYFFFPSEWDKESKRTMLEHYRILIHKDGKYIGPFLSLSKGILISFINGQILSLNAFVTLGFGKIPTTGLAKYACIVQGFIGWFLLTLFTATLINQIQI